MAILAALAGPRAPDPQAPPPRAGFTRRSPDAGLLRLCAAFQDANARSYAAPDDTDEWKIWIDRRWQITGSIERMVPSTDAGRLAKAGMALVLLEESADLSNPGDRFAVAALRDLVGSVRA